MMADSHRLLPKNENRLDFRAKRKMRLNYAFADFMTEWMGGVAGSISLKRLIVTVLKGCQICPGIV